MENPVSPGQRLAKPVIKGVIGAGAATVFTAGVLGFTPLVALPIAVAGVVYAKTQAKAPAAKVWGVIAGAGIAVAALTHGLDMVPTIASVSFALATVAPFATNQLRKRLSGRRQTQGAPARTVLQAPPAPYANASLAPAGAPPATVNVEVPAAMAEKVAKYVESLQRAEPETNPDGYPRRTPYRPA